MATPFFVLKLVAEELDAFESLTVTSATLLCFALIFFFFACSCLILIDTFSSSKTISINFWFAPKNGTNNTEDSENSPNTTSAESIKETKLDESTNTNNLRESSASSAEEQKRTDEDVAAVETEKEGTEKEEMKADENTEDQEEDEQEKTLTPAQHLELLRETELALFKATFNHKKVRKRGEVALKFAYWPPCALRFCDSFFSPVLIL